MKCTSCNKHARLLWYIGRRGPIRTPYCDNHLLKGLRYYETENEALRDYLEALL